MYKDLKSKNQTALVKNLHALRRAQQQQHSEIIWQRFFVGGIKDMFT